ncbi:hypothetical protein HJFPF1_12032 [Paramyrothecium foliicola]|nr:hypothetical protein HJFPF1_12032 [Paramyrothecium foliicola]
MNKLLQTDISAGMPATAVIHDEKPTQVSDELNGKDIREEPFCPTQPQKPVLSSPLRKGRPSKLPTSSSALGHGVAKAHRATEWKASGYQGSMGANA